MRLTKFTLATLLAACALAAATPGSHKSGSNSDSDSCSGSSSDSDSCSSSGSGSSSDSCSDSDSDSDGGSCHKGGKYYPAPWGHGSHPQYSGEWNYGQYAHYGKHKYFDGVYVYVDGLFKKRSALLTFVQPTGIPVTKFVRKGCTAVDLKVNQVVVAPLTSAGKVKTTFYKSVEDCEKRQNAIKKIGFEISADLGGKKIGAVRIEVPKKHRKSHKSKKHHDDHKDHHDHEEEHHHKKGKGKKHY